MKWTGEIYAGRLVDEESDPCSRCGGGAIWCSNCDGIPDTWDPLPLVRAIGFAAALMLSWTKGWRSATHYRNHDDESITWRPGCGKPAS